eukprot:1161466-Pelagomonas_calceolata.AAC.7
MLFSSDSLLLLIPPSGLDGLEPTAEGKPSPLISKGPKHKKRLAPGHSVPVYSSGLQPRSDLTPDLTSSLFDAASCQA